MRRLLVFLLVLFPLLVASSTLRAQSTGGSARWTAARDWQHRIPEDFHPLTRSERVSVYLHDLIGPQAVAYTALSAGVGMASDVPHEWPRNARGFGYRAASNYGQNAISATVESGLAFALNEDNRYFASGEQGTWRRLKYAVSSAFLARHDNGARSFSFSAVGGVAAGAAISRAWQPSSTRSVGDAFGSFAINMGVRVGSNVAREFLPRTLRRLVP
jgi:hypothetical protein